jgi:Zn finger protein HypA/HybF involved in hydrogenase expression
MRCHHTTIPFDSATNAHSLTALQLQQISLRSAAGPWPDGAKKVIPATPSDNVQCAVCHREHHGVDIDITKMTNNQCQTCHQRQFTSFAVGHPELGTWPHGRRRSIAFDHGSHAEAHFPKNQTAFDCRKCHANNDSGSMARTGSFEATCAVCHQQPLQLAAQAGVSLLELPMLDTDTMAAEGIAPGPWPPAASGVDRFQISPLTRALLAGDAETSAAMEVLLDPRQNNPAVAPGVETLRSMRIVADAIRGLIDNFAVDPGAAISDCLKTPSAVRVVHGLSPEAVAAARTMWFRDNDSAQSSLAQPTSPTTSGWIRNDRTAKIEYLAIGHADPILQSLVETATDSGVSAAQRHLLMQIPAVAACVECHQSPSGDGLAGWRATDPATRGKTFTKFSHRPHLNLPQLSDCLSCHAPRGESALPENSINAASFSTGAFGSDQTGSETATIDFELVNRSLCVSCHRPEGAGDGCTQCHNYHIQPIR